jgi:hypothetical protein
MRSHDVADAIAWEYQCWSSEEAGEVLASLARRIGDAIEDEREREAFFSTATMSGLSI